MCEDTTYSVHEKPPPPGGGFLVMGGAVTGNYCGIPSGMNAFYCPIGRCML